MMWRRLSGSACGGDAFRGGAEISGVRRAVQQLQQTSEQFAGISAQLDGGLRCFAGTSGIAENITKFLARLRSRRWWVRCRVCRRDWGLGRVRLVPGVFGMVGSALGMAPHRGSPVGRPLVGAAGRCRLAPWRFAALPGESAAGFAHRAMMPYWQSQGLEVGDHAADQPGEHQNGALDIMVPSIEAGTLFAASPFGPECIRGDLQIIKPTATGTGRRPRTTPRGIPVTRIRITRTMFTPGISRAIRTTSTRTVPHRHGSGGCQQFGCDARVRGQHARQWFGWSDGRFAKGPGKTACAWRQFVGSGGAG